MKAFRALLLALALSVCAYAGEIPCDKTGDMGAGGYAGEIPNGKAGWMETGKAGETPNDLITVVTLKLLQSVLTPF